MGLSTSLRQRNDAVWQKVLAHPFVLGIGDGSLAQDKFARYLRQDYLFLIEYSRVLALAAAKAPDLDGMAKFAGLAHATLTQEMELHRRHCAGFGLTARDLERTRPALAMTAYTQHLLTVAHQGSVKEIAAALLPCQAGYCEIAQHLVATGADTSKRNRYRQWIAMYLSDDFQALAEWLSKYLDAQTSRLPQAERRRLEQVYQASARHELAFWDMAYGRPQGVYDACSQVGARRTSRLADASTAGSRLRNI